MSKVSKDTATASLERPHIALGKQLGLRPADALVLVDVQRDFLPGGSLAIEGSPRIIARLNAYLAAFEARDLPIFLTRDWHPANHMSFTRAGGNWPPHCVQGTRGVEWAEGLRIPAEAHIISKGSEAAVEAYSGFSGTALLALLRQLEVQRLFVGGLATDYCVRATVLEARANGFDVVLLGDAIAGVNVQPGEETGALCDMLASGATLCETGRGALVACTKRRRKAQLIRYGFGKEVPWRFEEALNHVTTALQNEGFGVLTDIDVAATLWSKLGAKVAPYRILGACNPPLAQRALSADPSIGLLLPCNVVVREDDHGTVHVEVMDPDILADLGDAPPVRAVAREVRKKLERVIDNL